MSRCVAFSDIYNTFFYTGTLESWENLQDWLGPIYSKFYKANSIDKDTGLIYLVYAEIPSDCSRAYPIVIPPNTWIIPNISEFLSNDKFQRKYMVLNQVN